MPRLSLVASGGITRLADLDQLASYQLDGAIIGKAIYEGHISLEELERWQAS